MSHMMSEEMETYCKRCLNVYSLAAVILVVVPLIVAGSYKTTLIIAVLLTLFWLMAYSFIKLMRCCAMDPVSDSTSQQDQTSINSVSSSIPLSTLHHSPPISAVFMEMEAARRHAASLQPPAYPEVVQDSPGLHPPLYTTPVTDEASAGVFGPYSDGLPSYEAAMSTWQPPADEGHPTRRDDPPND